jgi:hypothetical protein
MRRVRAEFHTEGAKHLRPDDSLVTYHYTREVDVILTTSARRSREENPHAV